MTSRYYFAWRMVREARRLDESNFLRHTRSARRNFDPVADLSDNEFRRRYRLTKEAFIFLCDELRNSTTLKSSQRVSLEMKVLSSLTFYATGSYQRVVGMAENFSQETISVYLEEVTNALNHPAVINTFIKFPATREGRNVVSEKFFNKFGIPGVVGCIDGCHFKIFTPRSEVEHQYYCRKHYHSLNVQIICDSDCRILAVNPKFGGATHDAFIWENSALNNYMQSLHRNGEIVWLLGDSGYPLRPWLMTPCLNPLPGSQESLYNNKHGTARVVIENTFGRLKNRWRCLTKDRVLHYSPTKCSKIITACCVLHNLAIDLSVPEPEGPQEIGEVYNRIEVHSEDESAPELVRGRSLRDQLIRRVTMLL